MKKILYFSSTWCGPCKKLSPIMQKLKDTGMNIQKIDVGDDPITATNYGVRSIPTLVFLHDGDEKFREVGLQPESKIKLLWNQL